MNAMEIYKKNFNPPAWALKDILGGRLKGMSDINPQWRIEALTETFGLCGIGWKYEIEKTWLESAGGETSAFAKVNLFVKLEDSYSIEAVMKWSEPIPAIGGSSFLAIEKNGAYQSDECFKMAITDALSVCCKMLGIGGKIYLGSKYDKHEKDEIDKQNRIESEKLATAKTFASVAECKTVEEITIIWKANVDRKSVV